MLERTFCESGPSVRADPLLELTLCKSWPSVRADPWRCAGGYWLHSETAAQWQPAQSPQRLGELARAEWRPVQQCTCPQHQGIISSLHAPPHTNSTRKIFFYNNFNNSTAHFVFYVCLLVLSTFFSMSLLVFIFILWIQFFALLYRTLCVDMKLSIWVATDKDSSWTVFSHRYTKDCRLFFSSPYLPSKEKTV